MKQTKEKVKILEELELLVSAKRKLKQRNSLGNFVDIYLKHLARKKSPEFHYKMFSQLKDTIPSEVRKKALGADIDIKDKEQETGNNRILFVAPRGFAKSTICSRFYPLWLALNQYKTDIFIVSATVSLGKEHLRAIREELTANEKILRDFGEQKSDKWTEEHIVLMNGSQIRAKGRGFQIRGFRPDVIICDDLEDDEVIYSKEQREKLQNWYLRTLLPSLQPRQNVVYVGTKLHHFSLISILEEKEEFKVNYYRAIVNGKSIWPELWPMETLNKLRKELGEYAFQSEYMNNPISQEEQPVKPYMLDGVEIKKNEEKVRCMALDPAISEKETSDYRAITIFDRYPSGFKEVFSEHGRWGVMGQVDKIIDYYEKFKPDRIIIEEVAFQKILRNILTEKAQERGVYLPITSAELGTGKNKMQKDKLSRLLSVVHLFEQKMVQIDNPELKEELLAFPFGDYDDLVDATVYSLYWLMNSREGKILTKYSEDVSLDMKKSFYVKEIRPGVFVQEVGEPEIQVGNSNFVNFEK